MAVAAWISVVVNVLLLAVWVYRERIWRSRCEIGAVWLDYDKLTKRMTSAQKHVRGSRTLVAGGGRQKEASARLADADRDLAAAIDLVASLEDRVDDGEP